jgi:hypothetical protein
LDAQESEPESLEIQKVPEIRTGMTDFIVGSVHFGSKMGMSYLTTLA